MKKQDLFLMLATAAGLWLALKAVTAKAGPRAPAISKAGQQYTSIVAEDSGWKYYSDGTAIGPDGDYYSMGKKVYDAGVYPAGGMYAESGS